MQSVRTLLIILQVYKVVTQAKAKGFSDVLFLDALTGKNIEEVSTCNIFIVKV
jgi:branched-chain amino acid aminotransferase